MEPLELFDAASQWASKKVHHAVEKLDAHTPCDNWNVQALVNHMCQSQQYFISTVAGEEGSLPTGDPPDLIGPNAGVTYDEYRHATLDAFADPAVREKQAMGLGITFVDQLVHGWDVAKATGQDTTMPDGLAEAAFKIIGGNIPDERPAGSGFKPAISVADNVPAQDKLLAYTGRDPQPSGGPHPR